MDQLSQLQEDALAQRKNSAQSVQRPSDAAQRPRNGLRVTECGYSSAINQGFARVRDSQPSHNVTIPQPEADCVCIKEHQRIMNENARLLQELQLTRSDAEKMTKACRDLATWAYYERSRLIRELDAANASSTQDLEQAMAKEKSVLTQGTMTSLVKEVDRARDEIGLPPLSQDEMSL